MSTFDEFMEANARFAANFTMRDLPRAPARRVAVITCMDARMNPMKILGLEDGDANVIRNAGGRAADAIRTLVISQQLLGTREIAVVHHTDCGMLNFTQEGLQKKLRDELRVEAEMDFLPFTDLEQSVRDDVHLLATSPLLLPDTAIRGYIYDVHTGRLREVT